MKTLSVTEASKDLAGWLRQAVDGEQIGVRCGDSVVELRPVKRSFRKAAGQEINYAEKEYGIKPEAMARFAKKMDAEIGEERRQGRLVTFEGEFDPRLLD